MAMVVSPHSHYMETPLNKVRLRHIDRITAWHHPTLRPYISSTHTYIYTHNGYAYTHTTTSCRRCRGEHWYDTPSV
jgi:5-methylcytosine-specific restriction endonuclease McrA